MQTGVYFAVSGRPSNKDNALLSVLSASELTRNNTQIRHKGEKADLTTFIKVKLTCHLFLHCEVTLFAYTAQILRLV